MNGTYEGEDMDKHEEILTETLSTSVALRALPKEPWPRPAQLTPEQQAVEEAYDKAHDEWDEARRGRYALLCNLLELETGTAFVVEHDSEYPEDLHIAPKDAENFEGREPERPDFCKAHQPYLSERTMKGDGTPATRCRVCGAVLD